MVPEGEGCSVPEVQEEAVITDRELDAKVAEEVMGWTEIDAARAFSGWEFTDNEDWRYDGSTGVGVPPGKKYAYPIDRYSSTGDGMLAVVEALRGRGWQVSTLIGPDGMNLVRVMRTEEEQFYESQPLVEGDTLPRAVCLAALKAVGEGV